MQSDKPIRQIFWGTERAEPPNPWGTERADGPNSWGTERKRDRTGNTRALKATKPIDKSL